MRKESGSTTTKVLPGPSLDLALVRAATRELASLPPAALRSGLVEVARPLEPEARSLLGGALGVSFEARVVEELGAGVRVTTSAGQVDATASALARRAARVVGELGRKAPDAAGSPDSGPDDATTTASSDSATSETTTDPARPETTTDSARPEIVAEPSAPRPPEASHA